MPVRRSSGNCGASSIQTACLVAAAPRVDANTLQIDATVEDPNVLTGPWKVPTQTLQLAPFDTILSLNCASDEADAMIRSASQKR